MQDENDKERILKSFPPRVQKFLKDAEAHRRETLDFIAGIDKEMDDLSRKLDESLERVNRSRKRELTPRDKEEFFTFMEKVLPELY